jgi:hypothetical protein
MHLYPRGKGKFVQLIADMIRCKSDAGKIPMITGSIF